MNDHEGHLDRETAERLLDGAAASSAGVPVAELLVRAAAPARPHELSNEDRIVMAYRAAVLAHPALPRWRQLLTFKVIAAVLATLTAGGLAFASSTGIIPAPFREDPPSATTSSAPPPGQRPTTSPAPEPTAAITEEEVRGLCRAYLEKPGEERGRALQNPAFSRLVEAAGGAERVPAFCADRGGQDGGKPDKSHPSRPSKPPAAEQGRAPATEQGRVPVTDPGRRPVT